MTSLAILLPTAASILGLAGTACAYGWRARRAASEARGLEARLAREQAGLRRAETRLSHVVEGIAATGETFLQDLVDHLALAAGTEVAFIAEGQAVDGGLRVRTQALHLEGGSAAALEYDPAGAPCERALQGEICVIPSAVQTAFPDCAMLRGLQAEAYGSAPLRDSQGRLLGILAVASRRPLEAPEEVTALLRIFSARAATEMERRSAEGARAQFERQMLHAQKLESLGVLAGGIAHDFNNLLTAMLGHMSVAQTKLAPGSPALPHLESLERIIHRAADLSRQMLAYSGRGHFVVRSHDLNHMIQEVTHLLEVSIPKKTALRFHLSPDLPPVEADAAQIQQVVMNLVTNAADAIGEAEGTIRLSTGVLEADRAYLHQVFHGQDLAPGSYVTLEVGDTGCGMAPEVQARIFEPFFTTKVAGRGLGLSATMGILRSHRAGLRIYSEPGRGTTFKLLFPAAAARPSEAPDPEPAPARACQGTVLLVDDEKMILEAASAALESLGLSVLSASDGREALEVIQREGARVDLVLMDLTMPHMDGREAFQAIRRLRPEMPVVLSSGYNEQESIQDFMGRGLAGFLQKPYTLRSLEQTVLEALAKRPTGA